MKNKYKNWKNFSLKDFKEYYKKNHFGESRKQVINGEDSCFYWVVYEKGFVEDVFPLKKKSGRKGKFTDFKLKDFQEYYKENCEGLNRTEICKQYSGFYIKVWEMKLIDKVFPPKQAGRLKKSLDRII